MGAENEVWGRSPDLTYGPHDAPADLHYASHDINYPSHDIKATAHGVDDDAHPTVAPVQTRKGRRWSAREKARITAESFDPSATIAGVARRYGVSLGLLHYWRRKVRASGRVEEMTFVPVAVEDTEPALNAGNRAGIEIEVADMRIHILTGVDVQVLRTVLSALRSE
jgi:transposase